MNSNEYLQASERTDLSDLGYKVLNVQLDDHQVRLTHAALGMAGEVGEVVELVKKRMMYGKEFTTVQMEKECGDVLWYMAVMLRTIGSDFEAVMAENIAKLQARYPDKFSKENAIARKDEVAK